eukprot:TRINITY_DN9687_c0_g1_i2.p1 TRINITY_DN9687_c0_g1~~TRINITY_DN9687_c0_g1_i2.p1  ORF type:complete len:413 (+),score=78.33 TRINITY_DN9687_c0_g1_i2:120-1358(+)
MPAAWRTSWQSAWLLGRSETMQPEPMQLAQLVHLQWQISQLKQLIPQLEQAQQQLQQQQLRTAKAIPATPSVPVPRPAQPDLAHVLPQRPEYSAARHKDSGLQQLVAGGTPGGLADVIYGPPPGLEDTNPCRLACLPQAVQHRGSPKPSTSEACNSEPFHDIPPRKYAADSQSSTRSCFPGSLCSLPTTGQHRLGEDTNTCTHSKQGAGQQPARGKAPAGGRHAAKTLSESLALLADKDPDRLLVLRRINRLGLRAARLLKKYFSRYGEVKLALTGHSSVMMSSHGGGEPAARTRVASLGFLEMASAEAVQAILRDGAEHELSGRFIRVEKFIRRDDALNDPCEEAFDDPEVNMMYSRTISACSTNSSVRSTWSAEFGDQPKFLTEESVVSCTTTASTNDDEFSSYDFNGDD